MRIINLDKFLDLLEWMIVLGTMAVVASLVLLWPLQNGVRVEGVEGTINQLAVYNGKCQISVTPNHGLRLWFTKDISFCSKFQPGPATILEEVRYSKTLWSDMTEQRGLNFSIRQ